MNNEEYLEYFRAKGLLQFQAKIATSFLKNEDERYWELQAPVGTGKNHLAAALIAHKLEDDANKRILLLAPSSILVNWHATLHSFGPPFTNPNFNLLIVDWKAYLELESSVQVGESPWPLPAVILMSIDLAKRDKMTTNLSSVAWNLLVVDESQGLVGKRRSLFNRLIESGAIHRALLLTSIETQLPSNIIKKVKVSYEDLVDSRGHPIFAQIKREVTPVYYLRTEEEQTFLKELQGFVKQLANMRQDEYWLRTIILRVASSSIYTTEGMLRRLADSWRLMRNKISHDIPIVEEDIERVHRGLSTVVDDSSIVNELSNSPTVQPAEFLALYQKLESVLRQIEEIESDSKLDTLISYIQEQYESKERKDICVLSSFENTLQYINSSIQNLGMPVYLSTGAMGLVDRKHNVETFRKTGGILLITDSASEGLELENVDECINYDLPSNPSMFEQRWGRFMRLGRKAEFGMTVFVDRSKALLWEEEQLKTIGVMMKKEEIRE
jgi:superfamily II DNA or RNA helicase